MSVCVTAELIPLIWVWGPLRGSKIRPKWSRGQKRLLCFWLSGWMDECISHTNVRGTIMWRVLQIYYRRRALIWPARRRKRRSGRNAFVCSWETRAAPQSVSVLETQELGVYSALTSNHTAAFGSAHLLTTGSATHLGLSWRHSVTLIHRFKENQRTKTLKNPFGNSRKQRNWCTDRVLIIMCLVASLTTSFFWPHRDICLT